ncbi:MAG: rod shape-determining protein MreD [Pseudomonadota bacterium]|jgi:rod shape-determining protein MreD
MLRIALSLFVAFALTLDGVRSDWQFFAPPLVLLVTLYWVLFGPPGCGLGFAFLVGLLWDLASGAQAGRHALAFCVTAHLAQLLEHRVPHFTLVYQALLAGLLALAYQLIVVAVGLAVEGESLRLAQFHSVWGVLLLWPPLVLLLGRLHDRAW